MNIGILCYPTSGGSGVVATEMASALAGRGHDVHLVSYRMPFRSRPGADPFRFHKVDLPNYPLFEYPSYGLAAAGELARVIQDFNLDIIHAHYAYPHSVSAYLAREMTERPDLKIVTTLHGTDISLVRQDESFSAVTRFGIAHSDAVTAVSDFLRGVTEDWFTIEKPIEVIPNFVDTERFQPRPRKISAVPTLVHVSNFRPVKRSIDAIRAFYLVHRRVPSRLLMVGTGPELEEARALTEKLGLQDHVVFGGEEPAIERVLASADLLVSTSEFEGFGLAPLEAMACGIPVVATESGGVAEVVAHGTTGYRVPVGQVEALADRIVEILSDPALAGRFGAAGRQVACEKFQPPTIMARYERLYERLLHAGAPSRGGTAGA